MRLWMISDYGVISEKLEYPVYMENTVALYRWMWYNTFIKETVCTDRQGMYKCSDPETGRIPDRKGASVRAGERRVSL